MHLTPHEQERLLLHVAADVAAKRREQGLRLNYPEAMALLTDHVLEGARRGKTVSDVMDSGRRLLTRDDVMDGVPEMIQIVQVEATFPDGTKMATIHDPFPAAAEEPALHPGKIEHPRPKRTPDCPSNCQNDNSPYCCEKCDDRAIWHEAIAFNENLRGDDPSTSNLQSELLWIKVKNTSDRPVQVGSHYHFAEVNPGLEVMEDSDASNPGPKPLWNCADAKGRRLNIPAGSSVRFEPGDECRVGLVKFEGEARNTNTNAILGLRKGIVR
jgi:urease subunit gamma/beta